MGSPEYEPQSWKFKVDHFESLSVDFDYCMLGDSITDYAEWNELLPSYKIVNRGISGDTTGGVLKRLDQIIEKNPKKVCIMLGVNDVLQDFDIDDVMRNYQKIIDRLREASIEVVVVSTVYVRFKDDANSNRNITKLNDFLRSYGIQNSEVSFIDLNESLSFKNRLKAEYSKDGIHLNASAYPIWASHIKHNLEQ